MYSLFARWACQYFTKCYNPKLSSGCNSGKNLSKSRGDNQLVKHKNMGLYLQLYISNDHKEYVKHPWGNNEKEMRKFLVLYKVLTDII